VIDMPLAAFVLETTAPAAPRAGEPFVYSPGAEHRTKKLLVGRCTELDARACSPPRPIDAIRAAVATIATGEELYVRTRSRPDELVEALRRQGISAASTQLADGSWRMHVSRE
jgi:hypothetical protein